PAPPEGPFTVQLPQCLQTESSERLFLVGLTEQPSLHRLLDHLGDWSVFVLVAPVPTILVVPGRVPPEQVPKRLQKIRGLDAMPLGDVLLGQAGERLFGSSYSDGVGPTDIHFEHDGVELVCGMIAAELLQ